MYVASFSCAGAESASRMKAGPSSINELGHGERMETHLHLLHVGFGPDETQGAEGSSLLC